MAYISPEPFLFVWNICVLHHNYWFHIQLFLAVKEKLYSAKASKCAFKRSVQHHNKYLKSDCNQLARERKRNMVGELGDGTLSVPMSQSMYGWGCGSWTLRGKNVIKLGFQLELNKEIGGIILEVPPLLGANCLHPTEVGGEIKETRNWNN